MADRQNGIIKDPTLSLHAGRKKLACVECRQQKSKCDYNEKFPNPCSRCAKRGLDCIIKRDFKRTCKRARAEQIEQVTQWAAKLLNGSLSAQDLLNNDITVTDKNSKDVNSHLPMSKFDQNVFTNEQINTLKNEASNRSQTPITSALNQNVNKKSLTLPLSDIELTCSPKKLGDIYMSSSEIAELFQEYATKYHQFLPVVDLSRGAEIIYNLSPCLFWVIILTGLRRKPDSIDLMTKLSYLVKSILAEITISPILRYAPTENDEPLLNVASVYSVQAFLIYTFWPPLTSSLSADTSWNTIGTAMFQAIRVGLNCANFGIEYAVANPILVNEQVRTWVSCNIVSQIIASSFGFPAYISFDHAIVNSSINNENNVTLNNERGLPLELRQMAKIIHFENQIESTLHANPDNGLALLSIQEKIPLISVLSQQLDKIESHCVENDGTNAQTSGIDKIRTVQVLVARVHLYAYYFMNNETEINFDCNKGLVKLYNAAIILLEHINTMCVHDPDIIKFFPSVFILNIWQSACIVTKLIHSSLNEVLDIDRGTKAYQNAVELTSNTSILKYDTAYRFSGIMKSIWSMFKNSFEQSKDKNNILKPFFNLSISVKSRMSVSVFFDCLYILKEKCDMARSKRERNNKNDKSLNPEDNASIIIRTIPLDPPPINAELSSGRGSNLSTPSNAHTPNNILSLKGILNKSISPEEFELPVNYNIHHESNTIREKITNNESYNHTNKNMSNGNDSTPTENENYMALDDSTESTSTQRNKSVQSFSANTKNIGPLHSMYAKNKSVTNTNNSLINNSHTANNYGSNEVPTHASLDNNMEQWDNWESDAIWKDVDSLLNDFAFNPTL